VKEGKFKRFAPMIVFQLRLSASQNKCALFANGMSDNVIVENAFERADATYFNATLAYVTQFELQKTLQNARCGALQLNTCIEFFALRNHAHRTAHK
jgi:hypothetical protein